MGKKKFISFSTHKKEEEEKDIDQDFTMVIDDLVNAFANAYISVDCEEIAHEVYTIDKLRLYFSAYTIPKMPDPLNQYLYRLSEEGFSMRQTSFNVPGILVRRKQRK